MLLIPKILLFFLKYIFNQLPRLSGRWVPGIPRGFHCGQIENCPHGWQIPPTQPWAPIPGTRHTDKTVEGRKIGMGGGGEDAKWTAPQTTAQTFSEELADPSHVESYQNHVSLHLWDWPLDAR